MTDNLGSTKAPSDWENIAQGAVWIISTILVFVIEPPGHSLSGEFTIISWRFLAQFLVISLNGVALIVAYVAVGKKFIWYWTATSVSALVFGIILIGLYGSLMLPWTCESDIGVRFVVGSHLTSAAEIYYAKGHSSCSDLLTAFANDPLMIWQSSEIFFRELLLGWIFVSFIVFLSISAIALLQAYKMRQNP